VCKRTEAGAEARAGAMKKVSSGTGVTIVNTKSSGAGAMFMNRRTPGPELYHFCDGSADLNITLSRY